MKVYIASGFEFWYDRSAKGYIANLNGKEVIVGKDKEQAIFYLDCLSKND